MAFNIRTSAAAILAMTVIAAAPATVLAASPSKTSEAQSKVKLEKKVSYTYRSKKVASSGSPYICTPSGFGHKGRCFLNAAFQ